LYVSLFFAAFVSFLAGAWLIFASSNTVKLTQTYFSKELEDDPRVTRQFIYGTVFLSAIITFAYYRAVGYNLFLDALPGKDIVDFKSARIASYSGKNYYAPGYVNQFKNVLLPFGLYVVCVWLYQGNSRRLVKLSTYGISALVCAYVLLGTGQRAPLVYSFLSLLFGISVIYKLRFKWVAPAIAILVTLFGLFSVLNGRAETFDMVSAITAVGERAFVNDQQEGLWGFRYVLDLDFAWFSDWARGIIGILPSQKGSFLAHELYYLQHGTTRGTSNLSTVGSTYYNGGYPAIFVFYFLLGCFYAYVYVRMLTGRKTVLRSMAYGGGIFLLSVFVAGPPVVLLNKGVLAFLLLMIIRRLRLYSATNFTPAQNHS
jgi:oligosaccharide repeat unit polymerase